MAMITFMSDSGTVDHYVAMVKARVLSHAPEVPILDISHHIKSYDIAHAAFILKAAYPEFPQGTVHIVGVNTQHRRRSKHIVAKIEGHYFVAPDNGVLALLAEGKAEEVVELQGDDSTFPELNLYAMVAARLAQGQSLADVGSPIDQMEEVLGRQIKITDNRLVGNVAHIDHYGNLITNISKSLFDATRAERPFEVAFGREKADRLSTSYYDYEEGDCVLFFNSLGFLEIAINKGKAAQLLGLKYDSPIIVTFK